MNLITYESLFEPLNRYKPKLKIVSFSSNNKNCDIVNYKTGFEVQHLIKKFINCSNKFRVKIRILNMDHRLLTTGKRPKIVLYSVSI